MQCDKIKKELPPTAWFAEADVLVYAPAPYRHRGATAAPAHHKNNKQGTTAHCVVRRSGHARLRPGTLQAPWRNSSTNISQEHGIQSDKITTPTYYLLLLQAPSGLRVTWLTGGIMPQHAWSIRLHATFGNNCVAVNSSHLANPSWRGK